MQNFQHKKTLSTRFAFRIENWERGAKEHINSEIVVLKQNIHSCFVVSRCTRCFCEEVQFCRVRVMRENVAQRRKLLLCERHQLQSEKFGLYCRQRKLWKLQTKRK
jgi:hypothetical protein